MVRFIVAADYPSDLRVGTLAAAMVRSCAGRHDGARDRRRTYARERASIVQIEKPRSSCPLTRRDTGTTGVGSRCGPARRFGQSRRRMAGVVDCLRRPAGAVRRGRLAPDGTSSRDTRALRAPSLNTTGMYSIVRHPLYLGAGLMWIGIAMSLRVWWLVAIVALAYWLYVERLMIVEEAFLAEQFPVEFPRWASRTRAFLPRPSDWVPSTGVSNSSACRASTTRS